MRPVGLLLGLSPAVGPVARRLPAPAIAALVLVLALAALALGPAAAAAQTARLPGLIAALPQPFGTTSLVSVATNGGVGNRISVQPAMSADGRHVAFASVASDLVNGDSNETVEVFVRDLVDGTTVRVPLPGGGFVPANAQAFEPSISADGNVVAYTYVSGATTAVAVVPQIVLAWDRESNETVVVSRTINGSGAPGRAASVSANGRYIAFVSNGAPIVPGDDRNIDNVFRFDLQTQTTELVSADLEGGVSRGPSDAPSISANGRFVAFDSLEVALTEDSVCCHRHVFVRDMDAEETRLVSVALVDGAGNAASDGPAISDDGSKIAFASAADNLVADDLNRVGDVFVRDMDAGTTTLASLGADGKPSSASSGEASISADGRIVAFASGSNDLIGSVAGGFRFAASAPRLAEVYARDVVAGETALISVAALGGPGGARSSMPSVGANGRFVAFASTSPRILDNDDDNNASDVFVRDLPPALVVEPPIIDFGSQVVDTTSAPRAATVRNDGWGPLTIGTPFIGGTHAADFGIVADGCAGDVLHRTEACSVSVVFTPLAPDTRVASLRIPSDIEPEPRRLRVTGVGVAIPTFDGELEVRPAMGPPGIVTVATGTGFKPGSTVELSWLRGITPQLQPITVADDGTFAVQVLIFHNDRIGDRDLEAVTTDDPAVAPATATFRVVSPPAQPPSYVVLRLLAGSPVMLVGRR